MAQDSSIKQSLLLVSILWQKL